MRDELSIFNFAGAEKLKRDVCWRVHKPLTPRSRPPSLRQPEESVSRLGVSKDLDSIYYAKNMASPTPEKSLDKFKD